MKRTIRPGTEIADDDYVFDAEALLSDCGTILKREVRWLKSATAMGRKLDAAESKDLVNYIRLLNEIKLEQAEAITNMSDADLTKIAGK